jgi:flagellar L-ring protein precursor FlgH
MSYAHALVVAIVLGAPPVVSAQSSSLYLSEPEAPKMSKDGVVEQGPLATVSYTAVLTPPPRKFAVQDLITIIIREDSEATSEGNLETEKESKIKGEVRSFPHLNLYDLLTKQLTSSDRDDDNPFPSVDLSFKNEFTGDGEYERKDTMTTRLTARVVDVKPNGVLSLEARTFMKNDDEEVTITVTGFIRPDDVTPANTVMSTQVFDLHVAKTHEGEIRKAAKKGLLTKILDTLFNF